MFKKKDVRDHEDEDENDELQTIYTSSQKYFTQGIFDWRRNKKMLK